MVDQQIRYQFDELFTEYNRQAALCSTRNQMSRAEAFPDLIAMGDDIVPLLLEALGGEEYGVSTQLLLQMITHADPTSDAQDPIAEHMVAINVAQAAELWREWGRARGYEFS